MSNLRVYGTFTKNRSIGADAFGRPNLNPPDVVDIDNVTLYEFSLDTDKLTYKFEIPFDYAAGPFRFNVIWTNDGQTDDDGLNVEWQLDYQVATEWDAINGSHANSPKNVVDTYVGATGWIEHHTDVMTIDRADFIGKICIFLKLSAITPPPVALTCEPHLIGLCFRYTAYAIDRYGSR